MKKQCLFFNIFLIATLLFGSTFSYAQQKEVKNNKANFQVVISELCFLPKKGEAAWVELRNISKESIDISGLQLINDRMKLVLPNGFIKLPSGAYVLIVFDGKGDPGYKLKINDLSFEGDNLIILHTPPELKGNILGNNSEGECVLYLSEKSDEKSMKAYISWGDLVLNKRKNTFQERMSQAVQNGLWYKKHEPLIVGRRSGGIKGPYNTIKEGGSIGIDVSSFKGRPDDWIIYEPEEISPGKENPIPVPKLWLPGGSTRTDSDSMSFSWIEVPSAINYHFQLCDDAECSKVVLDVPDCNDTYYKTPEGTLKINTNYYWRLRTIGLSDKMSKWSKVYKLSVGYPKK